MCGIAGLICLDGQERPLAGALGAMARRMARRGPDDEGFLIAQGDGRAPLRLSGPATAAGVPAAPVLSERRGETGRAFLAHRRLSILDLSVRGHQPMGSPDGRYWIVYNGEVFNFRDLRRELEGLGETFVSDTDTEVILAAWRRWGRGCLRRLNGMFAFAIWDDRDKTLFCARDRIGIKPFYWAVRDGVLLFASDIKTLLASGLVTPEVEPEGLYHALSFGLAPRPMTAFKGIQALEQAHWMEVSADGTFRRERYWSIPLGQQDACMTAGEAAERLEAHLRRAIDIQLVADVPIGTFMSGGVDSTLVSALAAQAHPGVRAYTLGFEPHMPEFDEVPQARATAAMHPMEHIVEYVRADSVIDHIDEMIDCYEEPHLTLAPNYVISDLVARNGGRVILNGLGGDELFGGYSWWRTVPLWRRIRPVAPLLRHLPPSSDRLRLLANMARARTPDQLHTATYGKQGEATRRALFADPAWRGFDSLERVSALYVPPGTRFTDPYEAMSYMDMMHYIGSHHVHRVDQFTMHFSLEGRFPLLDHELVEFAFTVPSAFKLRAGEGKWLLRQVARGQIADSCLDMKKKGFGLPVGPWMRGPLRDMVHDHLDALGRRAMVDAGEIRRRLRAFESGVSPYPQPVWQLVAVEKWMRRFIDGADAWAVAA